MLTRCGGLGATSLLTIQMSSQSSILKNPIIEIELAFIKVQVLFGIIYFVIFNYLLIPNEYFSFTRDKANLIVYGILATALLYVFFYKLIKLISSNYKYHLLAFFILALGLYITSLLYLEEIELTRFEITQINSPSEIINRNDDAYFVIKDFYIDKNICLNNYDVSYSTKNTDIYVKDYFLMPLVNDSSEHDNFRIWLGLTFAQNVNNRILTRGNVEVEIQNARKRNQWDMNYFNYDNIKYFHAVKFSTDNIYFEKAINEFQNSDGNQSNIILTASLNDLSENRINYLIYILLSILITNIVLIVLSYLFLPTTW